MKSNVCVASLCDKLCSERNMIRHEQACIEGLNIKLEAAFSQLHKQVWICRHSQEILQKLINSNAAVSPTNCCQLVNNLCTSTFMDAHKVLKNYAAELIEVYTVISTAPHAISMFLNGCEQLKMQFSLDELCSSVFNMLYGSCFFPEDEQIFLELLDNLIQLQLVPSPDPRKVLRKGCSMFSRMYKYFSEALPITKIFFTAALHDPIMFLLSQDELFLDIDPLKSPIRIPAAERLRRFGRDENSDIYKEKMAQHRCVIVNKLVLIADRFITSIVNAMPIFPRSISILVSRMKTALTDQKLIREDEAALLCTELIFTYFICSAIINPEPLGIISDTPISHVARFNLMQIGQILQTLAIMPYEQRFPAYFNDILSRLDNGKIITAMESVLHSDASIFPVQISDSNGQELFRRRAFYGTLREINILQAFLKSPAIGEIEDSALLESLVKIVLKLPEQFYESRKAAEVDIPEQVTPSPMGLRNFVDKVQTVASRGHHRLMQTSSVSNLRSFQQRSISATQLTNEETLSTVQDFGQQSEHDNDNQIKKDVVLIFTLPDSNGLVGMQSKDEIQRSSDKEGDVNDQTTSDLVPRSEATSDAKRKLRLVLASATSLRKNTDLGETNSKQQMPTIQNGDQAATKDLPDCEADEEDDKLAGALQRLLDFLLAESINSRNSKQTAQIREVQRCLSVFDLSGIRFILKTLEKENRHTLAYIQYLQESKGTLLQMDNFLEEMNKRILGDTNLTSECLMEMMVRFNLQKKDIFLRQFVHEFQRLFVQDEKIDFVESHLNQLCAELVVDPMWRHATLENIEYARKCFERSLMANIYIYALFPNADADYYRDQVLHKSIQQLSDAITVDNAELAIPNSLHTECPWPSAQAELGIINAYKSPRDKMACITRCCETIENLIVLSSNRVTASADNILPILVFVIIKANPAGLLSNLQFIDGFYARRMQGSEAYWWTQFNSAVEFLKTLLNKFCH